MMAGPSTVGISPLVFKPASLSSDNPWDKTRRPRSPSPPLTDNAPTASFKRRRTESPASFLSMEPAELLSQLIYLGLNQRDLGLQASLEEVEDLDDFIAQLLFPQLLSAVTSPLKVQTDQVR